MIQQIWNFGFEWFLYLKHQIQRTHHWSDTDDKDTVDSCSTNDEEPLGTCFDWILINPRHSVDVWNLANLRQITAVSDVGSPNVMSHYKQRGRGWRQQIHRRNKYKMWRQMVCLWFYFRSLLLHRFWTMWRCPQVESPKNAKHTNGPTHKGQTAKVTPTAASKFLSSTVPSTSKVNAIPGRINAEINMVPYFENKMKNFEFFFSS